jgi:hypothetical protein
MAKKVTKKTAKGKKLNNLAQTHGKEDKFQPTTLEQIWGDDGMSKYDTLDEMEYEEKLKEYDKVDLQAHATKVGVVPIDNSGLLKQRLVKEFHKHINAYRMPSRPVEDPTSVPKEVIKILQEGK